MEYMANCLITEGSVNYSLKRPPVQFNSAQNDIKGTVPMPMDLYLPWLIPRTDGSKRKPSRPCLACNGSWSDTRAKRIPTRCTGIWCGTCKNQCALLHVFNFFTLMKTTKQYFWQKDIQHSFQAANELGSHRPILYVCCCSEKFQLVQAMQQITKLWPLLHVIM